MHVITCDWPNLIRSSVISHFSWSSMLVLPCWCGRGAWPGAGMPTRVQGGREAHRTATGSTPHSSQREQGGAHGGLVSAWAGRVEPRSLPRTRGPWVSRQPQQQEEVRGPPVTAFGGYGSLSPTQPTRYSVTSPSGSDQNQSDGGGLRFARARCRRVL